MLYSAVFLIFKGSPSSQSVTIQIMSGKTLKEILSYMYVLQIQEVYHNLYQTLYCDDGLVWSNGPQLKLYTFSKYYCVWQQTILSFSSVREKKSIQNPLFQNLNSRTIKQ